MDEIDLYAVLGVPKDASKAEVKKAYHKAALSSHPDKVAEDERPEAEIKFKAVSQAYEILSDDEKRHLYDTHGMAAFDPRSGAGAEATDLDDILQQMFGMAGGAPPGFGGAGGPKRPRKGRDEEQIYEVTLEEVYKGKTAKFASTKNVICPHCKGLGGKDKSRAKPCSMCQGKGKSSSPSSTRAILTFLGVTVGLRSVGPGLVTQETMTCSSCKGAGNVFKDKDRCKRCKGERVVEEKKVLELYIARGSKNGDRIVLEGEADQVPDQEPGDIVFHLKVFPHETFERAGADLQAALHISLVESVCGFSRVVLKHLDGRGIHLDHPRGRTLKPNQVVKVPGEGMPHKKSDSKGDLYLVVTVQFPEDGWVKDDEMSNKLQELLPKPLDPIDAETVDEVEYDQDADLDEFGAAHGHRGGSAWVDEDDEDGEQVNPQCAQQ